MRNNHREGLQPRFLTIHAICEISTFPIVKVMDTSFAQVRQKERIAYEMIRGSSNRAILDPTHRDSSILAIMWDQTVAKC